MERVNDLIDKLVQQQQQAESPERLLPTAQALYDELLAITRKNMVAGSKKVAVVMPSKSRAPENKIITPVAASPVVEMAAPVAEAAKAPLQNEPLPQSPYAPKPLPVTENDAKPQAIPEPVAEVKTDTAPPPKREIYSLQKPHITEMPGPDRPAEKSGSEVFHPHFNAVEETPTLLQQEPPAQVQKELHELISDVKESLNDKLKQDHTEVAHKLKDTPIKDLRKAIGVNDKFLFVSELFRGDEAMYERSIKTINGFHILPEAEYWINRELKVKLGWNDNRDAVQHFYHLVRRRFS